MTEKLQQTSELQNRRPRLRIFSALKITQFGGKKSEVIFPTELAKEIEKGASVPVIYSGPLYVEDPVRTQKVSDDLDKAYTEVGRTYDPTLMTPLEYSIARLEAGLPEGAFGTPTS